MTNMKITPQEEKLLRLIRETANGEVRIMVKDGHPIRAEQIRHHISLKDDFVKRADGRTEAF